MRWLDDDDVRRRQTHSGQNTRTAVQNQGIDLFGYEIGMGRNRENEQGSGWIIPNLKETGAPGDIRIRESRSFTGGFYTPGGNRVEVQRYVDGQWQEPRSDEEASEWISSLQRRGDAGGNDGEPQQQAQAEPRQAQAEPRQTQSDPNAEVEWTAEREREFERAIRTINNLGPGGTFSRVRAVRNWKRKNGYEANYSLTQAQYDEIMRQYREERR